MSLLSALLAEQGFKDKLKQKTYISLAKAQVSRLVSIPLPAEVLPHFSMEALFGTALFILNRVYNTRRPHSPLAQRKVTEIPAPGIIYFLLISGRFLVVSYHSRSSK